MDFRQHYKTAEDLENDEKRDVYPRRFITQLNCHQRHTIDVTYTLNVIKDGIIAKDYNFNIFIKGIFLNICIYIFVSQSTCNDACSMYIRSYLLLIFMYYCTLLQTIAT